MPRITVGRTLLVNDGIPYKITGVIRDLPEQSHFRFDFFVSLSGAEESRNDEWLSNNFNTYILLREADPFYRLEGKLSGMVVKYVAPLLRAAANVSLEDFFKAGNIVAFSLTPLTAIHLHSNKIAELGGEWQCPVCLYIFRDRFLYFTDCLRQLYEPVDGEIVQPGQGGGDPEGAGVAAGKPGYAVHDGVGEKADQCVGFGVSAGSGVAAVAGI